MRNSLKGGDAIKGLYSARSTSHPWTSRVSGRSRVADASVQAFSRIRFIGTLLAGQITRFILTTGWSHETLQSGPLWFVGILNQLSGESV